MQGLIFITSALGFLGQPFFLYECEGVRGDGLFVGGKKFNLFLN